MARRFILWGFVLFCLIVGLPGCWDRREIDELEIVQTLAVQPAAEGRVRLTFQIITPQHLMRGGTGSGAVFGGSLKPYRNISA